MEYGKVQFWQRRAFEYESWSTVMKLSWLFCSSSGKPAGDHIYTGEDRENFKVSSKPIACLLLQSSDCIWTSYIFSSTTGLKQLPIDTTFTQFISFTPLVVLEVFLLLHLKISLCVMLQEVKSWVFGGAGVRDLTKVKVKQYIFLWLCSVSMSGVDL